MSEQVRFVCKLCGIRSPQAILCTRDTCPTDLLVNHVASPRKQ